MGGGAGWDLGPRFDLTVSAVAGNRRGSAEARLEAIFAFHLNFAAEEGWGLYGGGGIAAHVGPNSAQYVLLVAGMEKNSRSGPFVEAGVGGGARVAAGLRIPVR